MTSHGSALDWEVTTPHENAAVDRQPSRVQWLDVARGLGILLVVAGHTIGGIIDSPAGAHITVLRHVFLAIYTFHMPLFFFLSGLFVGPRIAKGRTTFLLGMLATIVYPYFLWSTIQYGAIYAAGSMVNRPVEQFWAPILNLPFSSISQFWYLYVLFLMHMAALLIVPRLGTKGLFAVAVAARLIVAVVAFPVMIRLTFTHGLFYAAGGLVGMTGLEAVRAWVGRHGSAAVLILLLGITVIGLATTSIIFQQGSALDGLRSFQTSVLAWRLPILPAAIAGASAVMIAAMLQRGMTASILAYLGQRTMAIFVLHVLFIAGTRILFSRFIHLPSIGLLLPCMIAGLLGPLALYEAARRFTHSRLLGMG